MSEGQVLSLDQVRAVEAFAWHPAGYVYVDGKLLRDVDGAPYGSGAGPERRMALVSSKLGDMDQKVVGEGWHHLGGCRCRFCSPAS